MKLYKRIKKGENLYACNRKYSDENISQLGNIAKLCNKTQNLIKMDSYIRNN